MSAEQEARKIIAAIDGGDVDVYLRSIVESVKARRGFLIETKSLPSQLAVPDVATETEGRLVTKNKTKKGSASVLHSTPIRSSAIHFQQNQRPDPAMVPVAFKTFGTVQVDHPHAIQIGGRTYDKTAILGRCITVMLCGHDTPVQVVGIGPKKVKVLLVREPGRGLYHGKSELHTLWEKNAPIFVEHAVLLPYLQ